MPVLLQVIAFSLFWVLTCNIATRLFFRLFNNIKVNDRKITLFSGSFCPSCGHKLRLIDVIPIFSFLIINRKCRYCKHAISYRYIAMEVILLLGYLLSISLFRGVNLQSFLFANILLCLTIQSFIDLRAMMSSDLIHLITFGSSILLGKTLHIDSLQMLISFCFVIIFLLAIIIPFKVVKKKDGMGFGDVKLYAVLSVLFPLNYVVYLITLSAIFGILFFYFNQIVLKHKNNEFPLIPSIFSSFLLTYVIMFL